MWAGNKKDGRKHQWKEFSAGRRQQAIMRNLCYLFDPL